MRDKSDFIFYAIVVILGVAGFVLGALSITATAAPHWFEATVTADTVSTRTRGTQRINTSNIEINMNQLGCQIVSNLKVTPDTVLICMNLDSDSLAKITPTFDTMTLAEVKARAEALSIPVPNSAR